MYKIDNKKSTICRRFLQNGYKGSQEVHSMLLKKIFFTEIVWKKYIIKNSRLVRR